MESETQSNFTGDSTPFFDNIGVANQSNDNPLITQPATPPASLCSGTTGYIPYRDLTQLSSVWWTFVVLYIIVMSVSMVGNLMVIYTVCRHKYMRTVTNYYILNLAVCDFLISSIVMPLKLVEYAGTCDWQLVHPELLCPVINYILPVFVFASVFTLVAISIERYHAIVHPFESRKIHSQSRTLKILACTWIAAIVVPTPLIFCKSYPFSIVSELGRASRKICTDRFDEIDVWLYGADASLGSFRCGFITFLFLAIYLLPSVVIMGTCLKISIALLKPWNVHGQGEHAGNSGTGCLDNRVSRRQEENKRKVARMIIIVALTFIFSWSPFYVVNIVSQVQSVSFLRRSNFLFTMLATHLCGFINSAINPIVYQAMSDRFRRSFSEIGASIVRVLCCGYGDRFCTLFRHRNSQHMNASSRTWSGTMQDSTMVTTYCNTGASGGRGVNGDAGSPGNREARRSPRSQPYNAMAMSKLYSESVESAI